MQILTGPFSYFEWKILYMYQTGSGPGSSHSPSSIIAALRGHQIASWSPMIKVAFCTLRFCTPLPLPAAWPGPAVVPLSIELELAHIRIVVAHLIPKPESGAHATIMTFVCQKVPSTTEREH